MKPSWNLVVSHYNGDLSGRWILTAGLGGMGGAQPLAATMAGASCLAVECQPSRIEMRLATEYLDRRRKTSTKVSPSLSAQHGEKKPVSVAVLGNAAEIFPELLRRGVRPDPSPIKPRRTIQSTDTCRRVGHSPVAKQTRK